MENRLFVQNLGALYMNEDPDERIYSEVVQQECSCPSEQVSLFIMREKPVPCRSFSALVVFIIIGVSRCWGSFAWLNNTSQVTETLNANA